MIKKIGDMDGIPIYEDKYMEDNNILKGRKGTYYKDPNTTFFIATPKTANLIYKAYLTKSRKDKLDHINNL